MKPPWEMYAGDRQTGETAQRSPLDPARGGQAAQTPQAGAPQPWQQYADPASQQAQDVPETPNAGTYDDGFNTPEQPHTQLAPEDEAHLHDLYLTGTASQINQFLAAHGFQATRSVEDYVTQRDKAHAAGVGPQAGVVYTFPDTTQIDQSRVGGAAGAVTRGALDALTLGTASKGAAAIRALQDGGDFGEAYGRERDMSLGVKQQDDREHPWMRLGGELLGGAALPVGLERVGLQAGADVLRSGGTMEAARTAAAAAVRNRAMQVGGGYGAGHGVLSADDPAHALTGGLTEGALGAGTAGVLGQLGVVRANAPRSLPAPKVDYDALARSLDVTPSPATGGGNMAHYVQMGLGNLPGSSGVIAGSVERENAGLAAAARRTAAGIGPVSDRAGAGEALAQGAQDYAKTSRTQARALYDARDAAYGGTTAPVDLANLRGTYASIARDFPTSPALAQLNEHPVLRRLATALPDKGPITLQEATDALSHVRGVQRRLAASNETGPVLSRVGLIEQALEDDVVAAGRSADIAAGIVPGSPGSATASQKAADAFYADRKAALNGTLKVPYKSAKDPIALSGETVFNRLSKDTDREGGNLARVRDTWFRLPENARSTFAATLVDDMGRAKPGAQNDLGDVWSHETFLSRLDHMSPQARNIIFGARAGEQVRDIAAYASRLRDIGKSRNFSNTARNYFAGALMAEVGNAVLHGDAASVGYTIAAPVAANLGARLFLTTPAMRQWTARALKLATNPAASRSPAAGPVLVGQLSQIARANPQIANEVFSLQQRLASAFSGGGQAVPARLAADPAPNEPANEAGEAQRNQGGNQNAQSNGPQP